MDLKNEIIKKLWLRHQSMFPLPFCIIISARQPLQALNTWFLTTPLQTILYVSLQQSISHKDKDLDLHHHSEMYALN